MRAGYPTVWYGVFLSLCHFEFAFSSPVFFSVVYVCSAEGGGRGEDSEVVVVVPLPGGEEEVVPPFSGDKGQDSEVVEVVVLFFRVEGKVTIWRSCVVPFGVG